MDCQKKHLWSCHSLLTSPESSNSMSTPPHPAQKNEIRTKFMRRFFNKKLNFCVGLDDFLQSLPVQTILWSYQCGSFVLSSPFCITLSISNMLIKESFQLTPESTGMKVAQRGGGLPFPGNIQDLIGWGSQQLDISSPLFTAGDLDHSTFKGPLQLKWFCDSMILSVCLKCHR